MKLSEKFSIKITNYVKNVLPNKTEEDLEIIKYGIEVLFMNFTKIPIILCIGYLFKLFKEITYTILIFGCIRLFAAGIHARKSYTCLLCTCFIFFGAIYMSLNYKMGIGIKSIIFCISLVIYFKYAPADTEDKPYVDEQVRKSLKVKSIITVVIYYILSISIKNIFISNILINVIWVEGILILPLTYKIFNRRYNNYEYY